jgi:hypothetical protein
VTVTGTTVLLGEPSATTDPLSVTVTFDQGSVTLTAASTGEGWAEVPGFGPGLVLTVYESAQATAPLESNPDCPNG